MATLGHPGSVAAARLVTAAAGSLVPVLLAVLSARLFRRRGLAIATGFVAAIHPTFVLTSSEIQTEPLFLVFLLASGYLLLAATDRPSSNLAVLAGAALALAALTRSSALGLVPLLAAPLVDSRYPRRVAMHLALSGLLGFGMVLAPWTARNALVFHELIPVNDGAGYVFYGRKSEAALGLVKARDRIQLEHAAAMVDRARDRVIARLPPDVRSSPGRLSRALTRAALAERLADPEGTLRLIAWETWTWLRPYPDPRFWPPIDVLCLGLAYVALFVFAAVGLARAPRRGAAGFCAVFLAATMLIHVALGASWRYRSAHWDPILLLYGVFGAATLVQRPAAEPVAA